MSLQGDLMKTLQYLICVQETESTHSLIEYYLYTTSPVFYTLGCSTVFTQFNTCCGTVFCVRVCTHSEVVP